jgi:hypothetical protein
MIYDALKQRRVFNFHFLNGKEHPELDNFEIMENMAAVHVDITGYSVFKKFIAEWELVRQFTRNNCYF